LKVAVMNLNQVTLPATDMQQSVQFYCDMGFIQIVAAEGYARFECPAGDSTFSLHKVERAADSGVVVYFECSDLDQRVAGLRAKGFTFLSGPRDQRWLWRETRLRDPAGNMLCLFLAGENRKNPPWRKLG
jgi:catechol 2,3-dioxygenase-like lactoylglutathione lyase family enzyme